MRVFIATFMLAPHSHSISSEAIDIMLGLLPKLDVAQVGSVDGDGSLCGLLSLTSKSVQARHGG